MLIIFVAARPNPVTELSGFVRRGCYFAAFLSPISATIHSTEKLCVAR